VGDPDPIDPCEENPEAEGCAPESPVDACIEEPTTEGCEPEPPMCKPCPPGQLCPDVCEPPDPIILIPPPKPPGDNCLFDPSLPECAPICEVCPSGYLMDEDGQCYPDIPCPSGYERIMMTNQAHATRYHPKKISTSI
jgi:hypothetical protein